MKTQKQVELAPWSQRSVRWMIRRDMAAVEAIEAKSFEYPWTEDQSKRLGWRRLYERTPLLLQGF